MQRIFMRICRLVLVVCIMVLSFDWTGGTPGLAASPLLGVAVGLILGTLPVLAVFAMVGCVLRRRWFCTFGCPLGLIQDATVWIRRRLFFLPNGRWAGRVLRTIPDLKYALLILCLAGICRLIPVSLIWLDPQGLFNAALIAGLRPDFLKGTVIWTPGLVLVPGIVVFSFLAAPKFWCLKFCPTGALQEFLYLPARTVKKVAARRAAEEQPKSVEAENDEKINEEKINDKKKNDVPKRPVQRRRSVRWPLVQNGLGLLAAIGGGLLISAKLKSAKSTKPMEGLAESPEPDSTEAPVPEDVPATAATDSTSPDPIRIEPDWIFPPGSVAVREEFVALCIRCGNCIGNCPTGLIQPISFETSNGCWGVPRLEFSQPGWNFAYCEENCVRCTQSCPTGALTVLTVEEKSERKLGKAELEFGLCRLFWEKECRICLRECPQEAIEFRWSEEEYLNIPIINLDLCNGCGRCAARCPGDNYWEQELSDPPPRRKALKIV